MGIQLHVSLIPELSTGYYFSLSSRIITHMDSQLSEESKK